MWLTTSDYKVGIFTKDCNEAQCKVPERIDVTSSKSLERVAGDDSSEYFLQYNNRHLFENQFTGTQYKDVITFDFNGTESQNFATRYLAVHNSKTSFTSSASGYIGLGPYSGHLG